MGNHEVFDNAVERFRASLPEDERMRYSPCASADDLIDGLAKLDVLAKQRQKQLRYPFVTSVKALHDRLQPYFDVVGICIQANPTYTALAWGALRLIFQYAQIAELCRDTNSSRMKSHLEKVYIDLFQFFQDIAQIFTNSKGKLRKTPVVIGELMWKPFHIRFSELLERMSYHRSLVKMELDIVMAKVANNAEAAAVHERTLAAEERSRAEVFRRRVGEFSRQTDTAKTLMSEKEKEANYHRIHRWLHPPAFTEALQKSQEVREQGTNYWLFDVKKFVDWRTSEWSPKPSVDKRSMGKNLLWIHGNPGSGKTILASSVIRELHDTRDSHGDTFDIGYYFFSSDNPNLSVASATYSAILAQILFNHRDDTNYIDKFDLATSKATTGGLESATIVELVDLLKLCLQELEKVYLIIDGIDECNDSASLVRNIHWLTTYSNAKILLFSRTNVAGLSRTVPKSSQLAMSRELVSKDINLFLSTQVDLLIDEELLPVIADTPDLVARLVRGADGMFLWARLMSNYLNSPALTPAMRMRTIADVIFPEGLEIMYDRIFELIATSNQTERDLAQRIFLWLMYATSSLTSRQLHEALTVSDTDSCGSYSNQFSDLQGTIAVVCGGLVEGTMAEPLETGGTPIHFRFIHLSVWEYIQQTSQFSGPTRKVHTVLLPEPVAHLRLARCCLQSLTIRESQESMPNNRGISRKSFGEYAAQSWMYHLANGDTNISLFDSTNLHILTGVVMQVIKVLTTFLESPRAVTLWYYTYYSLWGGSFASDRNHLPCNSLDRFLDWIVNLPSHFQITQTLHEVHPKLQAFMLDMKMLTEVWGERLLENPEIIWDEVPAFTQSPFLATSSTTSATSLTSEEFKAGVSSSKPLCTISMTASNGKINGVLSIWPSRVYEEQWNQLEATASYSILLPLCSNWTARYEVWSIEGKPARLFDIRLPLQEVEISLQMRQSFRQESTDDWKTAFPLVISDDAQSFIILRTLFKLRPASGNNPAFFQSAIIPMTFSSSTSAKWTEQLEEFNPDRLGIKGLHFIHHEWYTYSFFFASNGRYFSFSDCTGSLPAEHHLAVFEILDQASLVINLVGSGSLQTTFGHRDIFRHVAFHPWFPSLIYCNKSILQLWNFRRPITEAVNLEYDALQTPRDITISSCGKYVVVTTEKRSSVIKIPEEAFDVQDQSKNHGALINFPRSIIEEQQPVAAVGSMDLSVFGLQQGQVFKGAHLSHQSGGSGYQTLTTNAQGEVTLTIANDASPGTIQSIRLVQLSQSHDDEMATSLIIPSSSHNTVRIIRDKTSQQAYTMNAARVETAPLIVDRDLRTVEYSISVNTSAQRPRLGEVSHRSINAFSLLPPVDESLQRPAGLGTSPSLHKVVGLSDDEETQAYPSDLGQVPVAKRLKRTGSLKPRIPD